MAQTLIKLIENELIKIFKKKSFYLLFILLIVIIFLYNYINPDEKNTVELPETLDKSITLLEQSLENIDVNSEEYFKEKSSIEFNKLYNSYPENSWQRYALNEENNSHYVQDFPTDLHQDIDSNLTTIIDYEINPSSSVQKVDYKEAKEIYEQYVQALNHDDWKEFVALKIKNLRQKTESPSITSDEKKSLNNEIEIYEYRLKYDIPFGNDSFNKYIKMWRSEQYLLESYLKIGTSNEFYHQTTQYCKFVVASCKYALENKLENCTRNRSKYST